MKTLSHEQIEEKIKLVFARYDNGFITLRGYLEQIHEIVETELSQYPDDPEFPDYTDFYIPNKN